MNEIKRAQNIIKAYARDLEGLTLEECADENFSPGQCEVLVQALGKGAEGKITGTDAFVLQSRHFSKEFISELAGADGNKALQQRGHLFANGNLDIARANIEDAVPALIEALKDETAGVVRYQAAWALREIKDARVVPALIEALKDKNEEVSRSAAWALREIKDARVVPALIEALKNESADVRYQAAWALREIKDARAVPALIEALKDEHWSVRRAAAYALGWIKDERAVLGLIEALKDKSADVREQAAEALGEIGHVAAIPPLQEMAKNDPDPVCRKNAERVLEWLRR